MDIILALDVSFVREENSFFSASSLDMAADCVTDQRLITASSETFPNDRVCSRFQASEVDARGEKFIDSWKRGSKA